MGELLMRRREMVMAGETPIIPHAYQQVDYIATDGNQYIWLRNFVTGRTEYKSGGLAYRIVAKNNGIASNTSGGILGYGVGAGYWMGQYGNIYTQNGAAMTNPREITVSLKSDGMHTSTSYRDYIAAYSTTGMGNSDFAIFAIPTGSSTVNYKAKCALYALSITKNGVLIADFIPCYRKSDGEIGLYDTANDIFYTNDGTGAFTKGADVN